MRTDYTCQNDECEHDFEITYTPETPDRGMGGRWEDAEQGSCAEAYPAECPECGEEVDMDLLAEQCS